MTPPANLPGELERLRRCRNFCLAGSALVLAGAMAAGIPPYLRQREKLGRANDRVLLLQQAIKDREADLVRLQDAVIAGEKRLAALRGQRR